MLYILLHSKEMALGTTPEWCINRNIKYKVLPTSMERVFPQNIQNQDQVVICGGSMNVDEETRYPWLKAEKSFIQKCLDKNIKIIGLCLGAQLLAEALGAEVAPHKHWEVGWWPIQLENELGQNTLEVFQWHGYRFNLPSGSKRVASNSICDNQGFTYQNNIYGFQFHPESTKEWILHSANHENYPQGSYVQTKEQILSKIQAQPKLQEWYFNFLDQVFLG